MTFRAVFAALHSIGSELVDEIQASPGHVKEIGSRWARRQVEGLIEAGVPCIHFYVMNDAAPAVAVVQDLL